MAKNRSTVALADKLKLGNKGTIKKLVSVISLMSISALNVHADTTAPARPSKGKVLLVASSTNTLALKGNKSVPTGYFLDELAVPAQYLISKGYEVEIATPDGNTPALDAHSLDVSLFGNDKEKLHKAMEFVLTHPSMQKPIKLSQAVSKGLTNYSGIFVPGGHGPMNDLMQDANLGKALNYFHDNKKPTALLCHGPVAILASLPDAKSYRAALVRGDMQAAKNASKNWTYAGYKMAIFSNSEEQPIQKDVLKGDVQFYVADALKTAGGRVEHGEDWKPFVLRDRELITGQNPASDHKIAEKFVQALNENALNY